MNLEAIVPLSLIFCDIIAGAEVNLSIQIRRLFTKNKAVRERLSFTAIRLTHKWKSKKIMGYKCCYRDCDLPLQQSNPCSIVDCDLSAQTNTSSTKTETITSDYQNRSNIILIKHVMYQILPENPACVWCKGRLFIRHLYFFINKASVLRVRAIWAEHLWSTWSQ